MAASFQDPKVTNAILGDVQAINELIGYLAKLNPSLGTNYPAEAIRLQEVDATNHYYELQRYDGTSWNKIIRIQNDTTTLRGYAPATSATAGAIPVYNSSGQLVGNVTGNAASATKLATGRKIQVGGVLSSTAQTFNGTADINIPVNQITVNNEADNALNGKVTLLHGGTGRTDGAAQDVVVSGISGEFLAKSVGQLGQPVEKGDVDYDTLVERGAYSVLSSTGMAKHQPKILGTPKGVMLVYTSGTVINQILLFPSYNEIWERQSTNSGASFMPWHPVCGANGGIVLFISKSGSDNNTGFESAYPIASFGRAIEIGNRLLSNNPNCTLILCIGAGDWGTVTFANLKFTLYLRPYDGAVPTAYSTNLPAFTHLEVENCFVYIRGCMGGIIRSIYNGFIYYEQGYKRVSNIQAWAGGTIYIQGQNAATNVIDFVQNPTSTNIDIMQLGVGGLLYFESYCHIRLAENITGRYFLNVPFNASCFMIIGYVFIDSSPYTFTGTKYTLASGCRFNSGAIGSDHPTTTSNLPAILNQLPGTVAGVVTLGAIIDGNPVGFGYAANYVAKAGGTMSGDLGIKKTSPAFIPTDTSQDITVQPSVTHITNYVDLRDKNNLQLAILQSVHYDNHYNENNIVVAHRINGVNKYAILHVGLSSDGTPYFKAGYPISGYNSNDTDIATTKWVQEHLANVVSSAVQKIVGQVTVQSSTAGVYTDWTLTNLVVNKFCFILANVTANTANVNIDANIRVISGAYNGLSLGNVVLPYSIGYHSGLVGSSRYYAPGSNVFAFIPSATTAVLRVTGYNQSLDLRAYQ